MAIEVCIVERMNGFVYRTEFGPNRPPAGRLLPAGTDNFVQMLKAEIESRQKVEAGRRR